MITSPETFTPDERKTLEPFFTNLDSHVFALTNLPETVKGALFARYSRSAKSLRRLFLDEFVGAVREASIKTGADLQLLEERRQPPDHPVSLAFPEGRYLKFFVFRRVDN